MKYAKYLCALSLLLSAGIANAAERTLEQQVEHRLERMTSKFALDAQQADKLKLWLTADETRKAEERKARESRRAEERKQLSEIFTAEQLAQFDAEKGKKPEHRKPCKKGQ
jgi:Spy/CpxP family protein refolding chaperone